MPGFIQPGTCETCRFGADIGESSIVCLRNPPVPDPAPYINTDGDRRPGVWLVISIDDWCGEFSHRRVGLMVIATVWVKMQRREEP